MLILWGTVTLPVLYAAKVAADIKFNFLFAALFVERLSLRLDSVLLEDDRVHAVDRAGLASLREELFTAHSTRNDVADQRVALGEVRCEVHFLPERVSAGKLTICTSF